MRAQAAVRPKSLIHGFETGVEGLHLFILKVFLRPLHGALSARLDFMLVSRLPILAAAPLTVQHLTKALRNHIFHGAGCADVSASSC